MSGLLVDSSLYESLTGFNGASESPPVQWRSSLGTIGGYKFQDRFSGGGSTEEFFSINSVSGSQSFTLDVSIFSDPITVEVIDVDNATVYFQQQFSSDVSDVEGSVTVADRNIVVRAWDSTSVTESGTTTRLEGTVKMILLGPELAAPLEVSAFATNVTSNGLERLVVGTEDGEIFLLDQGNPGYAYQGEYIPWNYSLTMNPFFADAPFLNIKYNEVMVHMKTAGRENIEGFSGVNFLLPDENEMKDSISIGDSTTLLNVDRIPSRISTHLPNVTDGFSLSISGTTEGYPAHIIQALTYKITGLSDANRQPKTY